MVAFACVLCLSFLICCFYKHKYIIHVFNRVQRIGQRKQSTDHDLVDFDAEPLDFIPKPERGHHHSSHVRPSGLSDMYIRVILDTGAEGTSISKACASRILREQSKRKVPLEDLALVNFGRFETPQTF